MLKDGFKKSQPATQNKSKNLLKTYQGLLQKYLINKSLADFQARVMRCNSSGEIYDYLLKAVKKAFFINDSAIIIPNHVYSYFYNEKKGVLQAHVIGDKVYPDAYAELENRWEEFYNSDLNNRKVIKGENAKWCALPLWDNHFISAILWVETNSKVDSSSFFEQLERFVAFAELADQKLNFYQQKERNLLHLSSLYETIETIYGKRNLREVIDLYAVYTRSLSGCAKIIFWLDNVENKLDAEETKVWIVKGSQKNFPEYLWINVLEEAWLDIHTHKQPLVKHFPVSKHINAQLICVPVKSGDKTLGLLAGIQEAHLHNSKETFQTLIFLADLCTVVVEKSFSEVFTEKMMLLEEQNRIASEIHDTISQNIFSIVYGVDALAKETESLLSEEQLDRFYNIRDLASTTAKDLRVLIFRLSSHRRGEDTFVKEIINYLDTHARLNQVNIKYKITGKEEYLNRAMQKAFYRIIKESIGNAIRHGKCANIEVIIDMTPFSAFLKVTDNGKGFEVKSIDFYNCGNRLGLVNMHEQAHALKGSLSIKSIPGQGTEIVCSIPTSPVSSEKA